MDQTGLAKLRNAFLFTGLESQLLERLASHCRQKRFGANQHLFHEGDLGHSLYIIISGYVNIQRTTPSGEIMHHARRGPGDMFGELSLIDGKPRMADVVTAEECELLILDRSAFVEAITASPAIALHVMSCLADRLRQAADQLESQRELDSLGRVARVLLELTESCGKPDPAGGTRLTIRITQQELAAQCGTTRETVNRVLTSLKASKTIRMDGRTIVVIDERKLRQFSSLD